MTKKTVPPSPTTAKPEPQIVPMPTQLIYADRIINFGIGGAVSSMTLGLEIGENTFSTSAKIVIPTASFIEGLQFIVRSFETNKELKGQLLESLDKVREQVSKF